MSDIEMKQRIQEALEKSDTRLLEMIYALIRVYKKSDGLQPQNITAYNMELDAALAEAAHGNCISLQDLELEMKQW
jgi:hypothetical protein